MATQPCDGTIGGPALIAQLQAGLVPPKFPLFVNLLARFSLDAGAREVRAHFERDSCECVGSMRLPCSGWLQRPLVALHFAGGREACRSAVEALLRGQPFSAPAHSS